MDIQYKLSPFFFFFNLFNFTFIIRPLLVQTWGGMFKRFASCFWVASKLRSFNKTYHNLWRSSKDFWRSSFAFQERPNLKLFLFNFLLLPIYVNALPVQFCSGNAWLFSKNWYKPLGLVGVAVSASTVEDVVNERRGALNNADWLIRCNKDMMFQWIPEKKKIGNNSTGTTHTYFFFFSILFSVYKPPSPCMPIAIKSPDFM